MNDILLTFKSCTLRQADIQLLQPGGWLNDQCILFYYEFLSSSIPDDVLLLDPSTSFLILFENDLDDLIEALNQINFTGKSMIFCAINDNNDPTERGGSHWSLLVYCVDQKGYYYDSFQGRSANFVNAEDVLRKLCRVMGKREPEMERVRIERPQNNSSDCGVYTLMVTEHICRTRDLKLRNQSNICPESALNLRLKILNTINTLITSS